MTILSYEGYFWNVTISYSKEMITRSEVYLSEVTRTLKLVKQVINPRDWIFTVAYDLIQLSIVNVHCEGTIILLYEQH